MPAKLDAGSRFALEPKTGAFGGWVKRRMENENLSVDDSAGSSRGSDLQNPSILANVVSGVLHSGSRRLNHSRSLTHYTLWDAGKRSGGNSFRDCSSSKEVDLQSDTDRQLLRTC